MLGGRPLVRHLGSCSRARPSPSGRSSNDHPGKEEARVRSPDARERRSRETHCRPRPLVCVGTCPKNKSRSERTVNSSSPVAEKAEKRGRRQHIVTGFRSRHTHCGDPWRRTRRPSSHIWRHIEGTVRRHHHRMRRRHPRRHVGPSRPQFHRRVVIIDHPSSRTASASNSTTKTTTPHAEISKPPRSSRTRRRSYTYKNRCDTRARRRTSPCCSRSH